MFRKVLVGLWFLALPTVAMAQTRVDIDRHKDFSRYKTFTLQITPPIRADGVVDEQNTLAEKRLRQAVTREFQARGLEATDVGADVTVRVSSREIERTVVQDNDWYGYPWGRYRRWGYWGGSRYWGPSASDVWTHRYLDGSVMIDVIERDTGELVYRAQVTDEIGNNLDKQVSKRRSRSSQSKRSPRTDLRRHGHAAQGASPALALTQVLSRGGAQRDAPPRANPHRFEIPHN